MSKPKRFAAGRLNATANAQIYANQRGKISVFRTMIFHCGATPRVVKLAINVDGTSHEFDYAALAFGETLLIETSLILQGTDTLEAWQDAGTDINYVLCGLEMDDA